MVRRLILNLHTYGGLLCFSYLILFGISSLNFNHPFAFTRAKSEPRHWEQKVELPDLPRVTPDLKGEQRVAAKAQANHMVRRALGLYGHQRPWKESWWDPNDPNHYHASLVRPGVEYEVDVYLDKELAKVTETRTGVWQVIQGLHGFHGKMPDSRFVSTWGVYTELCTFVVLFAGASGIYLWTQRRNERRIGYVLLSGAGLVSLALMILFALRG
jgi:hypothetical protein